MQNFVIVLTGIYNYIVVHFFLIVLHVGRVPARAKSSICFDLIFMNLYNEYTKVKTAPVLPSKLKLIPQSTWPQNLHTTALSGGSIRQVRHTKLAS